jgi:hypothetical protein
MLIPWPSIQTQQTQEWNKRWKHNSDKQLSVRSFVTSSIYIITTQKGICSIHYTNPRKQWSCIPVATWTVPIKFKHIWLRAIPITNKLGIKQLSSLLTNYNRFHKLNFCHTNGMVQTGYLPVDECSAPNEIPPFTWSSILHSSTIPMHVICDAHTTASLRPVLVTVIILSIILYQLRQVRMQNIVLKRSEMHVVSGHVPSKTRDSWVYLKLAQEHSTLDRQAYAKLNTGNK